MKKLKSKAEIAERDHAGCTGPFRPMCKGCHNLHECIEGRKEIKTGPKIVPTNILGVWRKQ